MKHSKEEIINALKIIKDECASYEDYCYKCPFYNEQYDCCEITDGGGFPSDWIINDTTERWNALL